MRALHHKPVLALAALAVTLLSSACGESPTQFQDGALAALHPAFDPGMANGVPYKAVGDCSQAVLIDPGTVTIRNGIRMERNLVAECPLSGDINGVIRFTRSSTLRNGDGPFTEWDGPVWGETIMLVDEFYGQTGFSGTFEGPFSTDWQNLLFGTGKSNRRGTGDFQGLTMVGVTQALPGAPAVLDENGLIHGGLGSP